MTDRFPLCTVTKGSTFRGLAFETLYLFPSGLKRSRMETFWRQSSKIRGLHVFTCQDVTQSTSLPHANLFAPLRATSSAAHLHVSYATPCAKIGGACERRTSSPQLLCHMIKETVGKSRKWEKETVAASNDCGGESKKKKNPIFINCRLHMNLVRNKLNESSFLSFFTEAPQGPSNPLEQPV